MTGNPELTGCSAFDTISRPADRSTCEGTEKADLPFWDSELGNRVVHIVLVEN